MSNYASIDPLTGLPNGQAVLPEAIRDPSSRPGGASAQPAPAATAANGPGYGTGIPSLAPVLENFSLGVASGSSETGGFEMLAVDAVDLLTPKPNGGGAYDALGWPPPPPGGGGGW